MMKTRRLFLLICCALMELCLGIKKSQTMDAVDVSIWGLPKDEQYSNMYEITRANFEQKVLESRDVWIIVIYKEKLHGNWKSHAKEVVGTLMYGKIDYDEEEDLVKKLAPDLSEEDAESNVALVFPFGKKKKKEVDKSKKWPLIAHKIFDAEEAARKSIPDQLKRLTFAPNNMIELQEWIVASYYKSKPPRFPILCITDEPEPVVPALFLVLSYYFADFFAFGLVRKPSIPNMRLHFKQVPKPETYPHFLILLGQEPSSDDMSKGSFGMSFNLFPYIQAKYGDPWQFRSLVKYLFTANDDYRDKLPGRPMDEPSYLSEMSYVKRQLFERIQEASETHQEKNKDEL